MHVAAEFFPLDPVTGERLTLRAVSAGDSSITALNGLAWWPAITEVGPISMRLWQGDFTGQFEPGNVSLTCEIGTLEKQSSVARRLLWPGATVKLYAGNSGQAWPWTQVFEGNVDGFQGSGSKTKLSVSVDPLEIDILQGRYLGTGGFEGATDLKDVWKPLLLGYCKGVAPILVNAVDNIYQVSAYGEIEDVVAVYERGSSFGLPLADYPTSSALLAATIPSGYWATCKAEGLFRLGAPAAGIITADVKGHKSGGLWLFRPGEIMATAAQIAGVDPDKINLPSFYELDTKLQVLPSHGEMGVYLTDQEQVLSFVTRIAAPCNAMAGISLLGKLFVATVALTSPMLTLDAQGRQLPAVVSSTENDVSPPFSYMELGWGKSWRVHNPDEIAGYDDIVPVTVARDTPPAFPREGQAWRRPSDGKLFVFTKNAASIGAEIVIQDNDALVTSGWIEAQDGAIPVLVDAVEAVSSDASQALGSLDAILSDQWLTREEKPRFKSDRDILLAEQTSIEARATQYGITTEKTAYTAAITAMETELLDLYDPSLWDDVTGDTSLAESDIRAKVAAVQTTRRTLLNRIAELAGNWISAITSNGILDKSEKPEVIQRYTALISEQAGIDANATAYTITTEKTAYDVAVTALTSYLGGLSPAWNDPAQDTPITRATFDTKWTDWHAARQALLNKIAERAALGLNSDGTVKDGQVVTASIDAKATYDHDFAFADYAGWRITPGYGGWNDVDNGTTSMEATITVAATETAQIVKCDMRLVMMGDGSAADNLGFRVLRDGTTPLSQVPSQVQIFDGKRHTVSWAFIDDSPTPGATHTYQLQFQPIASDGYPYFYNVFFDALCLKK